MTVSTRAGRDASGRHGRLDVTALVLILLCCLIWGVQQVAIKTILGEAPPLFQAALRSLGAGLLVWLWSRWRGIALFERDGTLGAGVGAGALFAAEFVCVYTALQYTNASRLVVFLYMAPFVVAIGLPRLVPSERLKPLQACGLAGAFIALAWAFQEGFGQSARNQLLGDALAVAAALFWGLTTLVVRASRLSRASPEKTLFYQLAVSGVLLAGASIISGEKWPLRLSGQAVLLLGFQIVVVAFASFLTWFWLLRHYPATRVSSFTFLTPMFGLASGALLLHESIAPRLFIALACVAVGIWLVNRKG